MRFLQMQLAIKRQLEQVVKVENVPNAVIIRIFSSLESLFLFFVKFFGNSL